MWKGPGQEDPGDPESGPPPNNPASSQELSDLKDQFEQQEVLIAQLKELIRKSEQTNVTQEKVDEYMNTLTKVSARAKKGKKKDGGIQKTMDTPAKEKINLLRQQLEENKMRLAERGKNQKGIEDMVTQMKAQLDDSQQLISQSPLNLSLQLQESKIDYSPNLSSDELYNILLTKEKKITELSTKVQKLENNVLDLQENLKEKDSVIDARTKAITLMTENLSKKGKTTLDTLDETREQMRKMQENFVSLESDMKARQMKLLDDLRLKNYEIAELQELNFALEQEKNELNVTIDQFKESSSSEEVKSDEIDVLRVKIEELQLLNLELSEKNIQSDSLKSENLQLTENISRHEETINKLTEELEKLKTSGDDVDNDVSKLKKQLDESNKNMIKVKAQHKSKVKELTKEIEAFKKVSDVNAELVRIQAENSRLNQKYQELEEETKNKDNPEIVQLKSEIEELKEQLESLSHLRNAQVSSEMTSIQFEEQLDGLEKEKTRLQREKEELVQEKLELAEEIETLKREKSELSQKLDSYIQENMDLVDKLEKLSTEKVSSAESIEIVEGLTQQEKIELEEYQKTLDIAQGNLKLSEETLPQPDLNESVNELTEETSELLQKIELFTVERREVMEKMEELKQENSQLSLKIEEVENNRDVLAETYEQLQTANELLKQQVNSNDHQEVESELEEAKQQIGTLQDKLSVQISENAELNNNVVELNQTLHDLQTETSKLKERLKILEDEKEELGQLLEKTKEELETTSNSDWENRRLVESRDEEISKLVKERDNTEKAIANLQQTINEKDDKFRQLSSKLQEKYEILQRQLETNTSDFENLKAPFEAKIDELTAKNKEQFEKMKKIAANLKKKTQAYHELEEKWQIESKEKDAKVASLVGQLEDLENEVSRLQASNVELQNLTVELKVKAEKAGELSLQQELLQTQGDFSTLVDTKSSLQNRIQELEMVVEERDTSLAHYKERVEKLEENFTLLDQQYKTLEERALDLATRLNEKSESCERMSLNEELLEKRLSALNANHEALERKCEEATSENRILDEEIRQLREVNHNFENEIEKLRNESEEVVGLKSEAEELEAKVASLIQINSTLESNLKDLHESYEKTVGEAKEEADLFSEQLRHLEGLLEEHKSKLGQNADDIADYDRRLNEANAELDDLRRLLEDKNSQIEKMKQENPDKPQPANDLSSFFDFPVQVPPPQHDEASQLRRNLDEAKLESTRLGQELGETSTRFYGEIENLKRLLEEKNVEIDGLKQNNYPEVPQPENVSSFFDFPQNLEPVLPEIHPENDDHLRKELEELRVAFLEGQEEICNLKRALDDKAAEIEKLKQQSTGGTQPVNNLSSFFDSPQPQEPLVSEIRPEMENNELDELREASLRAHDEIDNLKRALDDKTAEIERLKQQLVPATQPANNLSSFFDYSQPPQQLPQPLDDSKLIGNGSSFFDVVQEPVELMEKRELRNLEVGGPTSIPEQTENTQAELLNKIKTLEFMLYSVEKDKDDALLQCHEMSNELTRLVYERERANSGLESQILSERMIISEDTPDLRKDLQKMEFQVTNLPMTSSEASGPVVEPLVTTKEAYLCYPTPPEAGPSNIDPQVVSIDTLRDEDGNPESRKQLQEIEFERSDPVKAPSGGQSRPVDEEQARAKSAYLCYESGGSFDTFGENDDGWGWGPEEAKAEEEHAADKTKTESQIESLTDKLRVLELERENHLEEIKQLQIKSGKLIKKLKEFKVKNEQLQAASASKRRSEPDLFNLDDTIQEELKLQIVRIEKRLKETCAELEKEKSEKAAILKRVDVLTSANERMVEMKEKQDVELLGWQRNYRELSAKLERFEWGDDGFAEASELKTPTDSPTKQTGDVSQLQRKINELNETIKELTLDNEELQTLLEEQRALRITAEKSKSVEPIPENMKTEAEFKVIMDERDALNETLRLGSEEKRQLQSEINELIKKNDELGLSFVNVKESHEKLQSAIFEKDQIIERLNSALREAEEEKARLASFEESNAIITELSREKDTLFKELQEKNALIESVRESYNSEVESLKSELKTQQKSAQALLETNSRLVGESSLKDLRISEISAELQNAAEELAREWEGRVDQRGNDVAESWKLHLESRETEFAQMENALRKELNELEEKCNALVNENNELRRNVDAEIRNEVDRISALQQQINDRQLRIVELTKNLQEKQEALDSAQAEVAQLKLELQTSGSDRELLQTQLNAEKVIVNGVMGKIEELGILIPSRDADSILGVLGDQLRLFIENQKEIMNLRKQIESSDSQERNLEDLRRSLAEKDQLIANQTQQLQQIQNLHDYENENTQNLQQHILECQQSNAAIGAQLQEKTSRLEEALMECQNIHLSLQTKDAEISNLKMLLENKDREKETFANEQWHEFENLKRHFNESENRYEELLATKDGEMTLMQTQIDELNAELVTKSEEIAELLRKIEEQSALIDEDSRQLTDLRNIIEEQVLKIEEYKKELFQKSNDFDSLIAEMDISRSHQDNQPEGAVVSKERPQREEIEDDLSEPVRRAELDLALYMLHQRDVRCEELTVELTQLLEERDTLQLRLSNSIREKEEFVRQINADGGVAVSTVPPSTGAIPKMRSSASSEGASGNVAEETNSLRSKLSELRSVGYKKDKTIVDEQELRRFQELSIMQQHRDVAAKLPAEAAARLVDASYTLSRDVQSPSKVLLNWLWGRSTPKVNNI